MNIQHTYDNVVILTVIAIDDNEEDDEKVP